MIMYPNRVSNQWSVIRVTKKSNHGISSHQNLCNFHFSRFNYIYKLINVLIILIAALATLSVDIFSEISLSFFLVFNESRFLFFLEA